MIAEAARHASSGQTLLSLFTLLLAGAGMYYISLRLHPYTRCKACSGGGRNAGSNRKRWGHCRWCDGSGRKERLGVRLFLRGR